jgi:hypothetical protein
MVRVAGENGKYEYRKNYNDGNGYFWEYRENNDDGEGMTVGIVIDTLYTENKITVTNDSITAEFNGMEIVIEIEIGEPDAVVGAVINIDDGFMVMNVTFPAGISLEITDEMAAAKTQFEYREQLFGIWESADGLKITFTKGKDGRRLYTVEQDGEDTIEGDFQVSRSGESYLISMYCHEAQAYAIDAPFEIDGNTLTITLDNETVEFTKTK